MDPNGTDHLRVVGESARPPRLTAAMLIAGHAKSAPAELDALMATARKRGRWPGRSRIIGKSGKLGDDG